MTGAIAGLLALAGGLGACKNDGPVLASAPPATTEMPDAGMPDDAGGDAKTSTYNITVSTTPIAYADFAAACDERGGFVQTTAACAGNNACKGFSYIEPTLTEHSCKGMNSCGAGMSCVVLQPDMGLSGKEIYEGDGACAATCHAQFVPVYDPSVYTIYIRPGTLTPDEAVKRFQTGNVKRLHSTVAFGVHGINENGVAYANMPAHYSKYSRAEIERVVEYIRTLPIQTSVYDIPGMPGAPGGP